jgi:small multidrug resistance pump
MYWLYLILAIGLEVAGTTSMKLSQGFTKLLPSIAMFIFYIGSLSFLALALKKIEVGTAYALWSGIGTAAIVIIGIAVFSEGMSALKLISIGLIIAGVVGLRLSGSA